MREIQLPDESPPPSLEEQIRGAIYAAASYYWPTKITCGHRTVYLIDQWTYERVLAGQPKGPATDPVDSPGSPG